VKRALHTIATDLWVHQIRWTLEPPYNCCRHRRLSRLCCRGMVARHWAVPGGHVELAAWSLFHSGHCIHPSRPSGLLTRSRPLHKHTTTERSVKYWIISLVDTQTTKLCKEVKLQTKTTLQVGKQEAKLSLG